MKQYKFEDWLKQYKLAAERSRILDRIAAPQKEQYIAFPFDIFQHIVITTEVK